MVIARILVVLGVLLAAVSLLAGYVRFQALDTPTVKKTTVRHARRVPCQSEQVSTNRFHRQAASGRRTRIPGASHSHAATGRLPPLAKPCPHGGPKRRL